ncbi:MAG TPA: BON domain-containing protein [Burkholderiales bacterium]|nr:BON domain-containing protein [Burkholderiales bacterium]
MHSKIVSALIVAGVLVMPVAGYSAGMQDEPKASPKASVGEVVDDSVITTKIKADMAKDKAVSATSIKVETDKGVVQLSGTAKSKAEVDKAVVIATAVKGVTSVKNNIVVQTH